MATAKATKAAGILAAMYNLDPNNVPFLGSKVTVEDVRKYLSKKVLTPPSKEGDLKMPQPSQEDDLTGASVMVRGKFLGTVVGPVVASDGKRLWRVKSPSHSPDCETVAYATEDLKKAIG